MAMSARRSSQLYRQSSMEEFANDEKFHEMKKDSLPTPRGEASRTSGYGSTDEGKKTVDPDLELGVIDNMQYHTSHLFTWQAFRITYTTIWFSDELWTMIMKLGGVALTIAFVTFAVVRDPHHLSVTKFTEVSKFLNVIVGLLLGFFMSSSMKRWYTCVSGFLELLDSIRNLQTQFTALGVPLKHSTQVLRYAFASAYLLYGSLLLEARQVDDPDTALAREQMWGKLQKKTAHIDRSGKTFLLSPSEVAALRKTRDPPGIMWMWVATYIGRLAQDGWIPSMATPTYGRIMNLCQAAHGGIRTVRASITVQAPLSYTQMLAVIVHINNGLNAVTLGVVTGVALGTAIQKHHPQWFYNSQSHVSATEVEADWQNLFVTFGYCFIGPVVYQALLVISMNLAQPFGSKSASIPLDRLLHNLEVDMCNGVQCVEELDFEKPCFNPQKLKELLESEGSSQSSKT